MKTYRMEYPGDPPSTVIEMSRAEFLERYPDRKGMVESFEPYQKTVFDLGDNLHCDCCNAWLYETVWVWVEGNRGYCEECWLAWLKPNCTEVAS